MPQCAFYTAGFVRCSRRDSDGTDYCRTHQRKAAALGLRPPAEGHCHCVRFIDGQDQWCGQPYHEGETICTWHWHRVTAANERAQERQAREELRRQRIEVLVQEYFVQQPLPHWQDVARDTRVRRTLPRNDPRFIHPADAQTIARRYFILTTPDTEPVTTFTDFWVGLWIQAHEVAMEERDVMGLVPPPAAPLPPLGQMGRLAADSQNVHTAAVSKQTNSNIDLLLETELHGEQDTLMWLMHWWTVRSPKPTFEEVWKVLEDVRYWYGKRTCKSTGDYLYKRVLDGLAYRVLMAGDTDAPRGSPEDIAKNELHNELSKRLWEECSEAVGMCCEGHISRLANVLVGFDETFRPPVPVGEILQAKMAAIAEMKLSHKLKLQKAIAVMDELKIPVDDREPWLEALEA